jgi:hypothetical protein
MKCKKLVKIAPLLFIILIQSKLWLQIIVWLLLMLCTPSFFESDIQDFKQYILQVYALNGVNPYTNNDALASTVGIIEDGYATSPWGLILGNIFYPTWWPTDVGITYFYISSIIVIFIFSICAMSYFSKIKKQYSMLSFMVIITSIGLMHSLLRTNASATMICLLMLVVLSREQKFDIVMGVLFSLSFVKPQVSALIFLILLFERRFKLIISSMAIVFSSFITVCILLKENPFILIFQFLTCDVGFANDNFVVIPFRGMLSFLLPFVDASLVTISSMILGILLTIFGHIKLSKIYNFRGRLQRIILYTPSIMISGIWSYAWNYDRIALILPIITLIIIFMEYEKYSIKMLFCIAMLSLSTFTSLSLEFSITGLYGYAHGWLGGLASTVMILITYVLFLQIAVSESFKNTVLTLEYKGR